ncbi:adenylosuccinate synthetase [Mesorhizobium sp. SP-1A]|uniref:adenylosuccinate synthetase n=1 Tax=Mesorhizobium sp. SP-1A TaxID=3077840 RepID=UPI0028F6CBE7|nr:adenylosuccinate synthetase [Mesorhizobium sp. SP-1A]
MTKNMALAVIGSAYGDEGKGLMTDILAHEGADIVVRSNGGAQAGHTVTTPDGKRHVFHHFGSGAFAGVASHMSQFFVSHPMFLLREFDTLREMGAKTVITTDPRSIITTPYDMMINQFIEQQRAGGRHGSCGVGFGEAIERSLREDLRITVGDLFSDKNIKDVLVKIRSEWVDPRMAALGGDPLSEEQAAIVGNDMILERFIQDCEDFKAIVGIRQDSDLVGKVLFEGAQGLLLDQDYGAFPHVTRSNTGLLNMAAIANEAGIDGIDVHYMTRSYTTRHGAGPMAHEGQDMSYVEIVDPTNVHNDWQGAIRAAPLDLEVLEKAIAHDISRVEGQIEIDAGIVITCLDQLVSDAVVYETDSLTNYVSAELLACEVESATGFVVKGTSWGPTRESYRFKEASLKMAV